MQIETSHAIAALTVGSAAFILHKIRRIHAMLFEMGGEQRQQHQNLFRQIEAMQGLYAELNMSHSLPPMRDWAASPDFLLLLAKHVRAKKPLHILECSSGVSTLVLARCLQLNGQGKVYSLEHDEEYATRTREQLQRCGLQEWAEVIHAPLQSYYLGHECWPWYSLKQIPSSLHPDLLVIDGPPQAIRKLARYPAGALLFPLLKASSAIFLDDAAREDEQEIVRRWQTEFPAFAIEQPICEKGCAVLISA